MKGFIVTFFFSLDILLIAILGLGETNASRQSKTETNSETGKGELNIIIIYSLLKLDKLERFCEILWRLQKGTLPKRFAKLDNIWVLLRKNFLP